MEQYWFLSYEMREPKGGRIIVPVANVALAGIHPLLWLFEQKKPEATAFGMINHAIFYAPISAEMFAELERQNYMPTERVVLQSR